MPIPVRTLTTIAGIGLTGAGGYYYYINNNNQPTVVPTPEKPAYIPKYYDPRPFTLLDSSEIDARLRSGQSANEINAKNIKSTYTNQLASNNPIEDNYSINTFQGGLIAGVYDGHIGPHCSRFIKKQLPIYMARELNTNTKEPAETVISNAFVMLDQHILQRFYDIFPKNLRNTTEKDIQMAVARQPDQAMTHDIIQQAINGSCACTVYVKDGFVYSANTGDSRVVIVSQDEQGQWRGRRLVEEQSPAHPEWRAHLISQHPPNEAGSIVMRNRVFGLIAVGGSFGDIMYKVPMEYQIKVLPFLPYEIYRTFSRYHRHIVMNYRTPPYLESKPLVTRHELQKNDRFIILGTDGLWDELSWDDIRSKNGDQQAANIMSRWKTSGEANPATHLLREALLYQAVYKNVGQKEPVEDADFELSKRLTRQPSRNYRDDITITVIELDTTTDNPTRENVGPVNETEEVDFNAPYLVEPTLKKSSWFTGWMGSRL